MFDLLFKLMFVAALAQLGISLTDLSMGHNRSVVLMLEQRERDILRIDWKPITIFPEEAKRFR